MARNSKKVIEGVLAKVDAGEPLTLDMVGDVFGVEFYKLMMYTLLDANVAATAIAMAMNRLRSGDGQQENVG